MTTSDSHYLPTPALTAFPNAITLGLKVSRYECWRDTVLSAAILLIIGSEAIIVQCVISGNRSDRLALG